MGSKNYDLFTADNALHFAGGFIIAGVCQLAAWPEGNPWVSIPAAAVLGFVREFIQHIEDDPVWTKHRLTEASMWVVGAITLGVW